METSKNPECSILLSVSIVCFISPLLSELVVNSDTDQTHYRAAKHQPDQDPVHGQLSSLLLLIHMGHAWSQHHTPTLDTCLPVPGLDTCHLAAVTCPRVTVLENTDTGEDVDAGDVGQYHSTLLQHWTLVIGQCSVILRH